MMEKGLMKMKCMGISLNSWFGHENGSENGWVAHGFEWKREHVHKIKKRKKKKQKKICPTRDQVASRLLSGWGQFPSG